MRGARRVIAPLAGKIGSVCGKLERRIGACEVSVTELLLEQEKRIAGLERRLAGLNSARSRGRRSRGC